MTKYLSRDDILDVEDLKTQEVEVSEWGGTVLVREFTGAERDRFEQMSLKIYDRSEVSDVRAYVASCCIVDEDRKRLFTEADIKKLTRKAGAPLDRIFDVVMELSEVRSDSQAAQAVKDQAKANFTTDPNGDSTSD